MTPGSEKLNDSRLQDACHIGKDASHEWQKCDTLSHRGNTFANTNSAVTLGDELEETKYEFTYNRGGLIPQ